MATSNLFCGKGEPHPQNSSNFHHERGRYLTLTSPDLVRLTRGDLTMPRGMVMYQPAPGQAKRMGKAAKMVKVYQPPVENADAPAIVTDPASLKAAC